MPNWGWMALGFFKIYLTFWWYLHFVNFLRTLIPVTAERRVVFDVPHSSLQSEMTENKLPKFVWRGVELGFESLSCLQLYCYFSCLTEVLFSLFMSFTNNMQDRNFEQSSLLFWQLTAGRNSFCVDRNRCFMEKYQIDQSLIVP